MTRNISILTLLCVAILVTLPSLMLAADEQMREGTVVSAGGGSLTYTDMAGKQITLKVADSVPVTINGQMAKLSGLKAGMRIRVTITPDEQVKAVNTLDDHKFAALLPVAQLGIAGNSLD